MPKQTKKSNQTEYESPKLIDLKIANSKGAVDCRAGSSASGACVIGGVATSYCSSGTSGTPD